MSVRLSVCCSHIFYPNDKIEVFHHTAAVATTLSSFLTPTGIANDGIVINRELTIIIKTFN